MKVLRNHGYVATITYIDFSGSDMEAHTRDRIFESANMKCGYVPLYRTDLYDETLLTFDTACAATNFLTCLFRMAINDELCNKILSLRAGLCMGDYFHDDEQIYGETVNLATKLSYSSRKNEILVYGIAQQEIESYTATRNDINYFTRNKEENCYCISLIDEDSTNVTVDDLVFQVTVNNHSHDLKLSRNKNITIGRSDNADVFIDDDHISRNHATITLNDDKIFIKDHSSNGTYIYVDGHEKYVTHDTVSLCGKGYILCGQPNKNISSPSRTHNIIKFQLNRNSTNYM